MADINAVSCNRADVQSAIDTAQDGDTVLVPAGTATWTESVTIDGKALVLRGAGMDATLITDGGSSGLVRGTTVLGKAVRVTAFSLTPGAMETVKFGGSSKTIRIDHCRLHNPPTNPVGTGIQFGDLNDTAPVYGVVDHCDIKDCRIIAIEGLGHDSWKRPLTLGSDDAMYVEDCDIVGERVFGNAIDSNHGGRYVFRHNHVVNFYVEAHSLQNQDATQFARATRSYEVYENHLESIDNGSPGVYVGIALRGGTGVVFNNSIENVSGDPYNHMIGVDNVRSFEHLGGILGDADGTNPLDGNELPNGYPALDQIGRSTDYGPGDDRHPQELDPLYAWGNYMDGVPQGVVVLNNCGHHIQEGRDFYNYQKPGYTPLAYPHPLVTDEEEQVSIKTIPFTLTVTAAPEVPDFFPAIAPGNLSVIRGDVAIYQVSFTAQGGFTGPVTLAVLGLPAGAVAVFGQPVINIGEVAALSIATSGIEPGTFALQVQGTTTL